MIRKIRAIYEGGLLRPLAPIEGLAEHSPVDITVETSDNGEGIKPCVGILPDDDAEEMKAIIACEFESVI